MTDPIKPTYTLDDETRSVLEAALNLLAQVAEMQITDEGLVNVYAIANDLADRFGIESRVANITQNDDGTVTVTYTEEEDDDVPPAPSGTMH